MIKRILSNVISYPIVIIGFAIVLALAGFPLYFSFTLTGWIGIIVRLVIIDAFIYFARLYFYEASEKIDGPAASVIFFTSQIVYLVSFLAVIWMRNNGLYYEGMQSFFRETQMMTPHFLDIFITPFDINSQYMGIENMFLTFFTLGTLVIAVITTDSLNSSKKSEPDLVFIRLIIMIFTAIIGLVSAASAKQVSNGMSQTEIDNARAEQAEAHARLAGIGGLFNSDMMRYLILFAAFLFIPVITFFAVIIFHIAKKMNKGSVKKIAVMATIAVYAGFFGFSLSAEKIDHGFPRLYTPSLSQVRLITADWNKQLPELMNNYTVNIRRNGSMPWKNNVIKKVRDGNRDIIYCHIKDNYVSWRGEFWFITENNRTVIYRNYDGKKTVYEPGHPAHKNLIDDFAYVLPVPLAERWLPFYSDENYTIVTQNQANQNRLLLQLNWEMFTDTGLRYRIEMPPYFYFTDNVITIYDFTRYGRDSRGRITYGNAQIILPDDFHEYKPEPVN